MPDGNFSNINPPPAPGWPPNVQFPDPPTTLWPGRSRPELITDQYRTMLADPDGNIIGFDTNWGRNAPLARIVYAGRNSTRDS